MSAPKVAQKQLKYTCLGGWVGWCHNDIKAIPVRLDQYWPTGTELGNNGRKLQYNVMSRYCIERTNTQDSLACATNRNNLECVATFVVVNQQQTFSQGHN